jgi:hypothetical protein
MKSEAAALSIGGEFRNEAQRHHSSDQDDAPSSELDVMKRRAEVPGILSKKIAL